jgi:hypothetical protein
LACFISIIYDVDKLLAFFYLPLIFMGVGFRYKPNQTKPNHTIPPLETPLQKGRRRGVAQAKNQSKLRLNFPSMPGVQRCGAGVSPHLKNVWNLSTEPTPSIPPGILF